MVSEILLTKSGSDWLLPRDSCTQISIVLNDVNDLIVCVEATILSMLKLWAPFRLDIRHPQIGIGE